MEQPPQVPHFSRIVSMKSGLEGRNNVLCRTMATTGLTSLNEVRPRRPEQYRGHFPNDHATGRLNEVRPRRPEQCGAKRRCLGHFLDVSMKSGLEGQNNSPGTCNDQQ